MLFNSYIFIFLFLPITLVGFRFLRSRSPLLAKIWLIAMSLWFYGYFNIGYLAIMVVSILFNYGIYRLIITGKRKMYLFLGIIGNIALLGYFKYTDFMIESCNHIFGTDIPLKNILLPLGISFFTFQQIGFLADAYRGELPGIKTSFVDYALFVSFFPQLIAGPIADGQSMLPQYESIGSDRIDEDKLTSGIVLFILGLAKKVLIADTFGKAVDYAYGTASTGINSAEALLAVLFYALQLYFDFSGYCDMALGLGAIFGVDIPVNFDSPYKSRNIIEFWRRWHITLNRFLTKNVYIPLGGNRKGNIRTYVNLLIVFLISGIWHGAGVTFIVWGCMHGIMYVITRAVIKSRERNGNEADDQVVRHMPCTGIISGIITFVFVCVAWVFFRSPDMTTACTVLESIATGGFGRIGDGLLNGFNTGEFWYALKMLHLTSFSFSRYIIMILFAVFGLATVFFAPNALHISRNIKRSIPCGIMFGVLFIWCVLSLSGVSTFLYFNF